jgi:hypothetical protein
MQGKGNELITLIAGCQFSTKGNNININKISSTHGLSNKSISQAIRIAKFLNEKRKKKKV